MGNNIYYLGKLTKLIDRKHPDKDKISSNKL